jgi:4-hydroxy-tetrahydrodipicolinate synthase
VREGVAGVVPVGTTGESPTLSPEEHVAVIEQVIKWVKKRVFVLAGTGSNSTQEALEYTGKASELGADGVLLVDCYYNGPSSYELSENYYKPIAQSFSNLTIVPYIIPGRTGTALLPEDLAILAQNYPNINAVKEASGDFERMRKTRELLPRNFKIFSGDDDKTFAMMVDPQIRACGVISVISNIAPAAVQKMCEKILHGEIDEARKIREALDPLFKLVTVFCERPGSGIKDRFRNPVPIKIMMQVLGMPSGPCRPPLGKITLSGAEIIRDALKEVWEKNAWVLQPIEEFYQVDIPQRIANNRIWTEIIA